MIRLGGVERLLPCRTVMVAYAGANRTRGDVMGSEEPGGVNQLGLSRQSTVTLATESPSVSRMLASTVWSVVSTT